MIFRNDFEQSFSFIDPSKVETNFVCLLLLIFFFPFGKHIGGVECIFCVHPTCHLPLCSFLFLCILAEFFKLFPLYFCCVHGLTSSSFNISQELVRSAEFGFPSRTAESEFIFKKGPKGSTCT